MKNCGKWGRRLGAEWGGWFSARAPLRSSSDEPPPARLRFVPVQPLSQALRGSSLPTRAVSVAFLSFQLRPLLQVLLRRSRRRQATRAVASCSGSLARTALHDACPSWADTPLGTVGSSCNRVSCRRVGSVTSREFHGSVVLFTLCEEPFCPAHTCHREVRLADAPPEANSVTRHFRCSSLSR